MPLELFFHPLSSFCQKVVMALYENDTRFEPHVVDLSNTGARAAFLKLWPIGKFPVLRDGALVIPESSIIIEYLAQHYPGSTALIPADPELARLMRFADRFYDLYINVNMQKIVGDKLRPPGKNDDFGVEQAYGALKTALGVIEEDMAEKTWAIGENFTMADCAAGPSLYYADMLVPFAGAYPNVASYLERLSTRPCFARALWEAEPYRSLLPL